MPELQEMQDVELLNEKRQMSAAGVSFWASVALFLISAAAGLMVDSVTLLLDASASLVILAVAFLMNSSIKKIHRPPDEIFNFGYEKYEPFTVVLQGALIMMTCVISVKFAVQDIIHAEDIKNYQVPMIAALVSALIGVYVSVFLKMTARRTRSSMMHTASLHWTIDTFMSAGMLGGFYLGSVLKRRGYEGITPYVDPVMAIMLALMFIMPSARTIRKSLMDLLDAVPSKDLRAKVKKTVEERKPEYFDIHRIRLRKAGEKIFVEICLLVKGETTVKEAESLAAAFEKDLRSHLHHLDIIVYFKPK